MPNYANDHDVLLCEPPDDNHEEYDGGEAAMLDFIEHNGLPGGKDAADLWDRLGEKVGDTDLIWEICRACHYGKHEEVTRLGRKLASMLHDTANEMIDAET